MYIIREGGNETLFKVNDLQYRKGQYEVYYSQPSEGKPWLVGIRNINNLEPLTTPVKVTSYDIGVQFTDNDVEPFVTLLSTLLGFNEGGGGSSEVPTLQQVTDKGSDTTNQIITSSSVSAKDGVIINGLGSIKGNDLTGSREYELPDKSGTVALISDIPTPVNAQGDPTFTQNVVRNSNGDLGYVNRGTIVNGSGTVVSPNFSGFVIWNRRLDTIGLTVSVFCSNPSSVGEDTELIAKVPSDVAPFNDLMLYGFLNVPGISTKFDPVLINMSSTGDITIFFSTNNRPTQSYSIDIQQQYMTK